MARQQAAHSRIHDYFVEQIRQGKFGDGKRLPTEAEIADEFGVSRATVQFAMSRLAWGGWIERTPGRGTFVALRMGEGETGPGSSFPDLPSYDNMEKEDGSQSETLERLGEVLGKHSLFIQKIGGRADEISGDTAEKLYEYYKAITKFKVRYRLISFGRTKAPEHIAGELAIGADEWIFQLQRLKSLNDAALEMEQHYFAPHLELNFDMSNLDSLSVEDLFVEHRIGIDIDRIEVTMKKLEMEIRKTDEGRFPYVTMTSNFLVRWFSENQRPVIFTERSCWGPPAIML